MFFFLTLIWHLVLPFFVTLQHQSSTQSEDMKAEPSTFPASYQHPPQSRPTLCGSKTQATAPRYCWVLPMTQQAVTGAWIGFTPVTTTRRSSLETLLWRMLEFIGATQPRGRSWAPFRSLLKVGLTPTLFRPLDKWSKVNFECVFWTLSTHVTSSQFFPLLSPSRVRVSPQSGSRARTWTVARRGQFCRSPLRSSPWMPSLTWENRSPPATFSSPPSVLVWYCHICC